MNRYMRPLTLHMVLGIKHSIVLGRHYYPMFGIQRACFGILYTVVMGLGITNTFHDDVMRSMIRQLMAWVYRYYILENGFGSKPVYFSSLSPSSFLFSPKGSCP